MICAPSSSSCCWVRPLTLPAVPTGMNAGVSIVPCGVCRRPRRAPLGSVFNTSNRNAIGGSVPQGGCGTDKRCPWFHSLFRAGGGEFEEVEERKEGKEEKERSGGHSADARGCSNDSISWPWEEPKSPLR